MNWFGAKRVLKGELSPFGEPRIGLGTKVYSPTQGFNLLQIRPNWFLGNWTLGPCLKWALGPCLKWASRVSTSPYRIRVSTKRYIGGCWVT